MIRARRITTPQAKQSPASNGESIFQNEHYYFLTGKAAGKQAGYVETKYLAIQQAKAEFNRRKLVKHESAFVEGFVSTVRGGFFAEKGHIPE